MKILLKIFFVVITITFFLNVQTLALDNSSSGKLIIEKAEEFIDLDQNTVKLLFKTNIGSQVQIFLGETKNKLVLIKTIDNYDFHNGMVINKLSPGKIYYYRIVSKSAFKKAVSFIYSFVKLNRVNTNLCAEWAKTAIFYEIFIRSFADGDGDGDGIGDFKGLTEKISYLKELGVTAIWLMPFFESPSYHGNDSTNYYKINPAYGTNTDFQEFLNAAHDNGMKVIADLTINDTSDRHPWFFRAQTDPKSSYYNYYVWADEFDDLDTTNWNGQKIWHDSLGGNSYLGVFGADMPDLNFRYYPVREEMKKIAHYWLDPNSDGNLSDGVDGFRLDAVMHIDDNDLEVTHNWWQEFNSYVKSVNPNAFLVGEVYAGDQVVASFLQDMDSCFNFGLANRIIYMSGGRYSDPIESIHKVHQKYSEYSKEYVDSIFITNHDQARIATILDGDKRLEKLAASLLLTLPGTPFIYYGEELGQEGNKPDEYIRGPLDWYGSACGNGMTKGQLGFSKYTKLNDGISVEEEVKDPQSLLNYYKKLIKIRKEYSVFYTGNYKVAITPKDTYGYYIEGGPNKLLVIHNLSKDEKTVAVATGAIELISDKATEDSIVISPYQTVILKY
jgi:alpha-amylase